MKNLPNILSVFRIFASITMLVFMVIIDPAENRNLFMILPGIIFVVGCISDFLDGKIARHYNVVSDFGKFIDPIGDKILTFFAMLGFIFVGADKGFPFMLIAISATLLREFTISSVRMMSATKGTVVAANILGKIKTVSQMVSLISYFVFIETEHMIIAQILLSISVVFTIISGANYVKGFFELMKNK